MKLLVVFFIFFFLSGRVALGQIKVSLKEKLNIPKGNNLSLPEEDYFMLNESRYIISRDGGSFLSIASRGQKSKEITITKLNDAYKAAKSNKINVKYKKYKLYVEKVYEANGEICVLSSHVNNNTKAVYFFMSKIDPITLKLSEDLKNIGSLDYSNSKKTYGNYGIRLHRSAEVNSYCISICHAVKKGIQPSVNAFILDENNEVDYKIDFNEEFSQFEFFDVEQIEINRQGVVCLINRCKYLSPSQAYNGSTKPFYGSKIESDYQVFFTTKEGKSNLIDLKNNFPEYDAKLLLDKEFAYLSVLSLRKVNFSNECSIHKFSISEQEELGKREIELSTALLLKDKDKMHKKVKNNELLYLDRLLISSEGELIILFQDYHKVITSSTDANGNTMTTINHVFGQIVLLNFDATSLGYNYSKKIMKQCYTTLLHSGRLLAYFDGNSELNIVSNVTNLNDLQKGGLSSLNVHKKEGLLSVRWKVDKSGHVTETSICSKEGDKGFVDSRILIDLDDSFEIGVAKRGMLFMKGYYLINLKK
ncbi:MAG: hypothetical protein ACI9N1_003027 [Flavobacteriales bacterium]|jgi:hypothetical protein